MEEKELIKELYFNQKYNLTEIAKKLGKSVSYISKILRKNENYILEKESRKKANLERRKKKQKEIIYKNRKEKIKDLSYQELKMMHEQDSRELSKGKTINNQALRKWCSSAYKYDKKKRRYEFDAGNALRPEGLPKYIKS